jgi:ribosomal protein S11
MTGVGMARDGVFKGINDLGTVDISYIKENTPIQFGGVKGKRPKRN